MKMGLFNTLMMEMGRLTAIANFEDPSIELTVEPEKAPTLTLEEGGVTVVLEFPNLEAIRHFQRCVARIKVPAERTPFRRS